MTYAFVQVLPGYTAAQYDAVAEQLEDEQFPGLLVHLAGPCPDGWRIIQVWASADDHAEYARGPLARALDAAGGIVMGAAPLYEMIEIHHVLTGRHPGRG